MSNPIAAHSGATSINSLGEREALMRSVVQERTLRALRDEAPLGEIRPGARVFRITRPTGLTITYDIQREVRSAQGDVIRPASFDQIRFKASPVSNAFGEIILDPVVRPESLLDPEAEKARAARDARRVEVIELEMRRRPEIVDYHKLLADTQQERAAEDAKRLADPGYAKAFLAEARKLGINLADGFAEALRGKAGVGAAPVQKG